MNITVWVTRDISDSGQIVVEADSATTGPDGSLIFQSHNQTQKFQGVIIPPGSWKLALIPEMVSGMTVEGESEEE